MDSNYRLRSLIGFVDRVSHGVPPVTVKPAGALDDEIDGRKIGNHSVEVEIQRLLHHLGGNQDLTLALFVIALFAKSIQHLLFDCKAAGQGEAGVEQGYVPLRISRFQLGIGFTGVRYRVANPAGALAGGNRVRKRLFHRLQAVYKLDPDMAANRSTGFQREFGCHFTIEMGQQRVGIGV